MAIFRDIFLIYWLLRCIQIYQNLKAVFRGGPVEPPSLCNKKYLMHLSVNVFVRFSVQSGNIWKIYIPVNSILYPFKVVELTYEVSPNRYRHMAVVSFCSSLTGGNWQK